MEFRFRPKMAKAIGVIGVLAASVGRGARHAFVKGKVAL